jgi:hypothetical protein
MIGEAECSCLNLKIPPQMNIEILAIFHLTWNLFEMERLKYLRELMLGSSSYAVI